jgi:hypothetical protein
MIVPKKKRMLPGLPSVEITAAVAKNRIVMWHEVSGKWSGAAAAEMYAKLRTALRRVWGTQASYRVVEDGDPKGYQSNKGKDAKRKAGIVSWKLPPRTPEWNPLDFNLWHDIEGRTLARKGPVSESRKRYLARLRGAARRVPKDTVKKVLGTIKNREEGFVVDEGRCLASVRNLADAQIDTHPLPTHGV